MTLQETEASLYALIGHFNVNVAMSDDVPILIQSLSEHKREELKAEYERRLKYNLLGMDDFRWATACVAKDEKSARRFFEDVYKYAFESGEEPDVTDYWNRPKPKDW
ncbi:hypothetical protein [Celeribacter ethanolicus]|uniref:hypothetical protein n=1 Tax=Celeribacter ethanolicus TaxID=1758178 RepID=UPI0012FE419C|nr:hypothetical protein [Celeribacter ethanolicus]